MNIESYVDAIVDHMPLAYALLQPKTEKDGTISDFHIAYANNAYKGYFAPTHVDETACSLRNAMKHHNLNDRLLFDLLVKTMADGQIRHETLRLDITERYLEAKFVKLDENTIAVYLKDITEAVRTETLKDKLDEQHTILREALDAIPDMVAIKDVNGRYFMANRATRQRYAKRFDTIEGKTVEEVYPPKEVKKVKALDQEVMETKQPLRRKIAVHTDDDHYVVSDITRAPIFNKHNELIGIISVGRDISEEDRTRKALEEKHRELKTLTEKYRELSYRDDLTRLPNRRRFYEDIKQLETTSDYTLLLLDLNNFKQVNDDCGHNYGDRTLKRFADYLETVVEGSRGKAYRIGGDEFAVLVPGDQSFDLSAFSNNLNAFLRKHHDELSVAYGHTTIDGKAKKDRIYLDVTLKSADELLYKYKNMKK